MDFKTVYVNIENESAMALSPTPLSLGASTNSASASTNSASASTNSAVASTNSAVASTNSAGASNERGSTHFALETGASAITIFRADNMAVIKEIRFTGGTLYNMAYSPNGKNLAIATGNIVHIYSTNTYECIQSRITTARLVLYTQDGRTLLTINSSCVSAWDTTDYNSLYRFDCDCNCSMALTTADNKLFLTAGNGVNIYDLNNKRCVDQLYQSNSGWSLAQSGKFVFMGFGGGQIKVWDTSEERGAFVHVFNSGACRAFWAMCVSEDGKYLFAGSPDHTIKVFKIGQSGYLHIMNEYQHNSAIRDLLVYKDNLYCASTPCATVFKFQHVMSKQVAQTVQCSLQTIVAEPKVKIFIEEEIKRLDGFVKIEEEIESKEKEESERVKRERREREERERLEKERKEKEEQERLERERKEKEERERLEKERLEKEERERKEKEERDRLERERKEKEDNEPVTITRKEWEDMLKKLAEHKKKMKAEQRQQDMQM